MKRTLSLIASALMCLALALGCSGGALPAARVGDKVITVAQLQNMYDNNKPYSAYYGYALTSDEGVEAYQDYLLNMMVESRAKQYKAEHSGIELSSEELSRAKESAQASYDQAYQSFLDAAKNSGAGNVRAQANKLFTDALTRNHTTVRKMKAELLEQAKGDMLIAKHKEQLLDGVEASEKDIAVIYEEELAKQKEAFDEDSAAYFTKETYSAYGYEYVPLYVPEGLIRVRQILVADEATAQDILDQLQQGANFEELLEEYNTDPGMESNPEGYLVGKGASFVEEFLDAALALKSDGELSGVVQSSYGYHILKRVSAERSGAVPYEDIKESFEARAKTVFIDDYYSALVTSWMEEEGLVIYYKENYRGIGKAGTQGAA